MIYSIHGMSLFISEYLGVLGSNFLTFNSTGRCLTCYWCVAIYSIEVVTGVVEVFILVNESYLAYLC